NLVPGSLAYSPIAIQFGEELAFECRGRPLVFRILESDCPGLENYRTQLSRAAAEAIVKSAQPDLPPRQCRFEKGQYRCAWQPMLRTEIKDRADKTVAATTIIITASRPVIVVSKKPQHQIQQLQGFAGRVRRHGRLLVGGEAAPSIGAGPHRVRRMSYSNAIYPIKLGSWFLTPNRGEPSGLVLYRGRQFGGLRVRGKQLRETLGIAARHAAFGGYTVDPDMALGGGEARSIACHV